MFRGNSSPWRAQLEKTVTLIVTFELAAKRANHETNKQKTEEKHPKSLCAKEQIRTLQSAQTEGARHRGRSDKLATTPLRLTENGACVTPLPGTPEKHQLVWNRTMGGCRSGSTQAGLQGARGQRVVMLSQVCTPVQTLRTASVNWTRVLDTNYTARAD